MRKIVALLAAAGAMTAPASASPTRALGPAVVEVNDIDEALKAIAEYDGDRLFRDEAYALQILAHVETLRRSSHYVGQAQGPIDHVRMLALIGSGQAQEALAQATRLTRTSPGDPDLHYLTFLLGLETGSDRTLEELELADRSIRSEAHRIAFREALDTDTVFHFLRPFHHAKDKAKTARAAQTLLNLGWPGPHKLDLADSLRFQVAEGLLVQGDVAGAKRQIFALQSTRPVLRTLISRKWDAVRESGDPNERLAQAIAASDEASASALRQNPGDPELLLARSQALRSVGKDSEALQLLLPKAENLEWVKENGENGFWVVNEAAYALTAVKREKEAVALMQELLSLGLAEHPALINMAINSAGIRADSGDYRGAANYATLLATEHADIASPYGHMWMWAVAACGHALAGDSQAAGPWLAKLKAGEADNPAALTRSLLCANDIDGAAASVIRRLEGDDPDDMLIALQDYSEGAELSPAARILEGRLRQVVSRPDVQAAIAKHGRVMKVPLSRIYWGMF
jgi:hypothetical protein